MGVRGWVYVLVNQAMPGLVKVGFTLKDPILRVTDLDSTGLPFRFELAYEALVHEPRDVEQSVHSALREYHEAKEFFRCSVAKAVECIRLHGDPLAIENWLIGCDESDRLCDSTASCAVEAINKCIDNSMESKELRQDDLRLSASTTDRLRATSKWSGVCSICAARFRVTAVRGERGTHCPRCHSYELFG